MEYDEAQESVCKHGWHCWEYEGSPEFVTSICLASGRLLLMTTVWAPLPAHKMFACLQRKKPIHSYSISNEQKRWSYGDQRGLEMVGRAQRFSTLWLAGESETRKAEPHSKRECSSV